MNKLELAGIFDIWIGNDANVSANRDSDITVDDIDDLITLLQEKGYEIVKNGTDSVHKMQR